ncbi:MAG: DUF5103 domain-containing protein [Salibacteraceae bacterium]
MCNRLIVRFVGLTGLFLSLSSAIIAQDYSTASEYYLDNEIRYADHSYLPEITTVMLYRDQWELSPPFLSLNSEETLRLDFDDLTANYTDFQVTFIQCNVNWQPSELMYSEYVDGLPDDFITEYRYSRNTFQRFIHYSYTFPNQNIKFTKSGNYILVVYRNGNPQEPVITRRFIISEKRIQVVPDIHWATNVNQRRSHQEIDFVLNFDAYQLTNPYTDVHVVLMQNYRWDNVRTGIKPTFAENDKLTYDSDEENVFMGGNEYRPFDTKDLNYRSAEIERTARIDGTNHVYLLPDQRRSFRVYLDQPDINGWRLIKIDERNTDSDVDADYAYVHFVLPYDRRLPNGDIYIFGALTNWQYQRDFKMVYNENRKQYEASVFLKQGFYNYEYQFVADGAPSGDVSVVEGTHSQTRNTYTVLVYHRTLGDDYDRLVAAETFQFP